ncbi:MAG TPA: D-alanyl-D-alanine carboxypeptidase/D-alanyl-D-alanine-endopeptidase [Candidatus Baltobacteraceae bacterium]|jgi:D-alanyl-D-alanine carboxypeptidase/D-alanyl-D-alanine-endopeptidase (penicillin-binding protein 4)|nr:D-alanyl-D-alanine carboxypeptidase/D-alanyl-D-alanine-endopeptidase [Candidatus Baltobacteraceae bacterium]
MRNAVFAALPIVLLAASAPSVPPSVEQTVAQVVAKPAYAHSVLGIYVADQSTGDTLIDRFGDKMYVAGSIMKTFSTASALKAYGPAYRFHTPVYRTGAISGGTVNGNLVLVASGDFSFGLREQPNGTLAFNSMPEIDHNYADTGFPGPTILRGSDPFAALNELAKKIRSAGVRRVRGNVVIDDRLFKAYDGWPDGPMSSIWINENQIDVTVIPGAPGQPARIDWRPKIATVSVSSQVKTVPKNVEPKPLELMQKRPGAYVITGEVRSGDASSLRNVPIPDPPAYVRIAFIEALRRAGVTVDAPATGSNPEKLLPARPYSSSAMIADHVSPPLSQFIKVILKVSYNRGADLMVCLVAVKSGSRECPDGLVTELKTITALGVSPQSTLLYDGAGSVDSGRTSPLDQVTFLRNLIGSPWGRYVHDGMAILGVDGTQAMNQRGTDAAGKVRVKDGSRVVGSPSGQVAVYAKTQVGYITARSGRTLVYGVFLNDVPATPDSIFEAFTAADHDVGAIVVALQQGY